MNCEYCLSHISKKDKPVKVSGKLFCRQKCADDNFAFETGLAKRKAAQQARAADAPQAATNSDNTRAALR